MTAGVARVQGVAGRKAARAGQPPAFVCRVCRRAPQKRFSKNACTELVSAMSVQAAEHGVRTQCKLPARCLRPGPAGSRLDKAFFFEHEAPPAWLRGWPEHFRSPPSRTG